jgi:DNA processing protein
MRPSRWRYWLRLTLIPGIGGETQRKLLTAFSGSGSHLQLAGRSALRNVVGESRKAPT